MREAQASVERDRQLGGVQHDADEPASAASGDQQVVDQRSADAVAAVLPEDEEVAQVAPAGGGAGGGRHALDELQADHADGGARVLRDPPPAGVGLALERVGERRREVTGRRALPVGAERDEGCEVLVVGAADAEGRHGVDGTSGRVVKEGSRICGQRKVIHR